MGRAESSKSAEIVVVALGSNLGHSILLLNDAMEQLRQFSSGNFKKSSVWESTPMDCPPGSPNFLNSVVSFSPTPGLTPETLLGELQSLEKAFGRKPKLILNEPRPLDLDIIVFGNEVQATPQLTLPHPRAVQRGFVLKPLAEIEPNLILPGETQPVAELANLLNDDPSLRIVS